LTAGSVAILVLLFHPPQQYLVTPQYLAGLTEVMTDHN